MFMLRSLELATYAIKNCRPNPAVGAVLVKNGVIVGEGYTQEPGREHAEIVAIKNAGENAKDADLYVTLEPCSHYGRTPPCTEAIIKAGIKKVYYGSLDSNPQVAGHGIEKLKQAGIEAVMENLNGQIDNFYESYVWFVKNKKPFITLKIAQTMDGFIANSNRTPLKITGEESQTELHRLRSFCDAVVVGGGTFRMDNPQLTVRKVKGANPQKVVFSRSNFNGGSFGENWNLMLGDFAKKGMHHILVEAGATLAQNLFSTPNSFSRFLLWTSPLRLGEGLKWNLNINGKWQKKFTLQKNYMQGKDFCEEFIE
ncbi:MAG: bifunctional diaminohydroxyphosphoribosylaminopyrimidine deaminase/5-amino-6-(5-phosphoribosylamino)uracil reductase RibD [Fibromonadaceae bacterium]|jgi:diaminohydroxyphosphoribosylaminopyrimidine deaminase/5-amino-6-(5-phosphoribosylamino)uracil reductase|nr:bifunctional diaminohydroxyphosphoribosylaminopyrimidine deaminase/5-amino-6-(5-phosphoribosylamino)uracil reductase RibD [Fibromonadaceae bacterium]